jgi:glucose 1-dehydrogenase
MEFAGKGVLITGAARGIGEATARYFASQGGLVLLTDVLDATPVVDDIKTRGGRARYVSCDITDPDQLAQAIGVLVAEFGRLDVAVAAAAFSLRKPFLEQPIEDARRTVDVTMWGTYHTLRAAAAQMVAQGNGGSIVVVSSPHAIDPVPECVAYNMAKAAVDQMARTVMAEMLPHHVRVNVIHPGWTDTPGERRFATNEQIALAARQLPAGRLARPDEIARAIGFLANPDSDYINGTTLTVDGGGLRLPIW